MEIKSSCFNRELTGIQAGIFEAINRVMASGWYILGDETARLEEEFSDYIGVKYAVSVNSGSDALYLALKALGVGADDEVITVSHTFISTVDAIVRNGAKPKFVDIAPDTYCMDISKIQKNITENTKAIIPVHIYGHPVDMGPLLEISDKYGISVIEDSCQAHGAEYMGKKTGGIGDIGCFSFYPTKNIGAYGDGGIMTTNDSDMAEKLKMLRNYGQSKKSHHDLIGINSRLDELQAAILRVKLKYLDDWNEKRRNIAKKYNELLIDTNVALPVEKEYARHVYHQYVIRYRERDHLQRYLGEKGIQTQVHYPVPVHNQRPYTGPVYDLPQTERSCETILSLPMNPWLTDDEVLYIAELIRDAPC